MGHHHVLATMAPAGLAGDCIQRIPESVQMNDVGDSNRFVDDIGSAMGSL
jgi:hypothetical protein